jgi:hypothetical protein
MSGRVRGIIAAVVALGATVFGVAPAEAATYEQWRFRDGQICYQDHGSIRWDGAASVSRWNAADVDIVTMNECTGFTRGMIIDLKLYNNPNEKACAKTGSNSYSWEYVWSAGKTARWVPNLMVIWINTASNLEAGCAKTSGMRAHLLSHELGHALGVGHVTGASSVMASWSVWWPTSWDLANVNAAY